jgi:hypothetical protein
LKKVGAQGTVDGTWPVIATMVDESIIALAMPVYQVMAPDQ